ncbi:hypothetical protein A9Z42_0029200 [Trichoderma parareesei]|uniref:Myb-like domain-containing protein n=1 Tax=Trichoderma parareesei TaxID=858221 RepID=A0A2H2ZP98_TRIPA|nr:hypothetical protein A9Z42_0029200 [Trichoderma parareesei]
MQTRRASKATAPEPSSPQLPSSPPAQPGVRRNPPRAKRPQAVQDVDEASSSGLSSGLSSPSARLLKGALRPSHLSDARPSSPSPVGPPASDLTPNASSAMPSVELPKGLTSVPRKGSIVFDPPPRRGAPRRNSGSSLRISPDRDSEDEPTTPPKSAAELEREEMILNEIEDAEHQLKVEASDSLARDAINVIKQLQDNKSRPAYQKVLSMKMQAFEASRRVFLAPGQAFPFLQYGWLDKSRLDISESTRTNVRLAVKLANIATALSHIERIESDARGSKAFLDALDANFPHHFAAEDGRHYLSLSLEIRTQRAIERIVCSAIGIDKRTELSWVFCPTEPGAAQAPKGGYPELFRKGPYRPLAGLEAQTLVNVCSARVLRIWEIMSDNGTRSIRSPMNMASVRQEFPFHNMLVHLKSWLMDRFQGISHLMAKMKHDEMAKEEERLLEQLRKEEAEARRALEEERIALQEERRAKEQELRAREEALAREKRRQQDQEQREAEAREAKAREDATAREGPRRRQRDREQERVRNADTPRREEHLAQSGSYPSPNADRGSWAGESSPESIRSSEGTPRRIVNDRPRRSLFSTRDMVDMLNASSLEEEQSAPESSRKRSEPENDDGSESAQRTRKKGKTASSSTTVRRRRRSAAGSPSQDNADSPYEYDNEEPATSAPTQRPLESQRPENPPAPPSSSAPDYAALRHAKEANRRAARLSKPRPQQIRHPWSEEDSTTLIELVRTRGARWADIGRYDTARFQHPRNAQAYRDKARNLKVDFLISDALLPEGFDQVALSQKEVDKVRNAGKNPCRLERHVDGHGRPTHTAYIP